MQSKQIKTFILSKLKKHPQDIVSSTVERFNVSRTTVHRHLNTLLKQSLITKSGKTKQTVYQLAGEKDKNLTYSIKADLSEFDIWRDSLRSDFKRLNQNIYDICEYGFTEICNNAIDHSQGSKLNIQIAWLGDSVTIIIKDNGVGLFQKLMNFFHLKNSHESAFQLSKGKLTTDPSNHTGEGVFFSSRIFDCFKITSNKLTYLKDNIEGDWFLETAKASVKGTTIEMKISINSKRSIVPIFKKFQDPETLAFTKTYIAVKQVKLPDETYISRSQAKRLLMGLDKFTHIELDFKSVRMVGQGFADQIFRIYLNEQPKKTISYINANEEVDFMIKRSASR